MKLQYGFFLNPQDRINFLFVSKRLPLSKDIVRYIAKNFFFDYIPVLDHCMKPYLVTQEQENLFEMMKLTGTTTIPDKRISDEFIQRLVLGFFKAGYHVFYFVDQNNYKQIRSTLSLIFKLHFPDSRCEHTEVTWICYLDDDLKRSVCVSKQLYPTVRAGWDDGLKREAVCFIKKPGYDHIVQFTGDGFSSVWHFCVTSE
jgi:hypothetical protein